MLLEVKNITKNIGGIVALSDVSFNVEENEILGIIGPNGAGKTTMFNLVTGVFPATSGEINLVQESLADKKSFEITRLGIARTFQNIRLFGKMTVSENVMIGRHCRTTSGFFKSIFRTKSQRVEEKDSYEKTLEILELVGLLDKKDDVASNLSYGNQRKLEIARALATNPKLLLLDEPAAGMNEFETENLVKLIEKIKQRNISIIVIEHDMNLIMSICDRIVVLNFGIKIADDIPVNIQNNQNVIEAYLGKG